ncbi:hypothetical protein BC830DRAFT_1172001 [Chytriomyces sp. MP71]|nr:hypothetical protein BC830DRAFT_1172001 [Chytriomyces sp. MP71]
MTGYQRPFLGGGHLMNAMRHMHNVHPIEKLNVTKELMEDRQRDEFQAALIQKLLKPTSTTRNRVGLVQALLSGEQVPPTTVAALLAEDWLMDHISASMVGKLVQDGVENRHADHIAYDFATGRAHVPHPHQEILEREVICAGFVAGDIAMTNSSSLRMQNFIKDQLAAKAVQRLTAPYAHKRIARPEIIEQLLQTLVEATDAGYGATVGPCGVEYCGRGGYGAYGFGGDCGQFAGRRGYCL